MVRSCGIPARAFGMNSDLGRLSEYESLDAQAGQATGRPVWFCSPTAYTDHGPREPPDEDRARRAAEGCRYRANGGARSSDDEARHRLNPFTVRPT